jgi:hypothetical protein
MLALTVAAVLVGSEDSTPLPRLLALIQYWMTYPVSAWPVQAAGTRLRRKPNQPAPSSVVTRSRPRISRCPSALTPLPSCGSVRWRSAGGPAARRPWRAGDRGRIGGGAAWRHGVEVGAEATSRSALSGSCRRRDATRWLGKDHGASTRCSPSPTTPEDALAQHGKCSSPGSHRHQGSTAGSAVGHARGSCGPAVIRVRPGRGGRGRPRPRTRLEMGSRLRRGAGHRPRSRRPIPGPTHPGAARGRRAGR